MKVREIHVLQGYCPSELGQYPCEQCKYYNGERCTHPPISVSLILRGDTGEVTLTFPLDTVKVTIAGQPQLL
ncbi:MAG: hypothetical protein ACTSV7_00130 [Candidatus Baldrarchaeia archaeon]